MRLTWQFLFPSHKGKKTMLYKCSCPTKRIDMPAANFISNLQISWVSVVRPLECSVTSLFWQDQAGLGHKHSKYAGTEVLTEQYSNCKLRESLPRDKNWGWNTRFKERKSCRASKGWLLLACCLSARVRRKLTNSRVGCRKFISSQFLQQY